MYKAKTNAIFLILIIGTISIATTTTTFLSQNIYAISLLKKSTGIKISHIKTNPTVIHLKNTFTIAATVTNNSPNTIKFEVDGCGDSSLTATFDKNVNVPPSIPGSAQCNAHGIDFLKPGDKTVVTGPGYALLATGIGKTKANITFGYTNMQGNSHKVNKSFVFTIVK